MNSPVEDESILVSVFEAIVASSFRFPKAREVVCASIVDDWGAFLWSAGELGG